MNSKTYAYLRSKAITFDLYGELVASVPGVMPIIDGDIDVLEFIPDGDIIVYVYLLYLWAQRSGMQIELSREVQFIQDNTDSAAKRGRTARRHCGRICGDQYHESGAHYGNELPCGYRK